MDALTPDLAEKVLTADVRNLIKKVSDGGTLSASARTMFHKAAMLPGLRNDARVASLMKKWASGGRLSSDELIELRAWSDAPPAEPLEPSPSPASSPAFALTAEGPLIVGSRVKYPEPLSAYAALYDSDERSIKRYVARGRSIEPPDLPPLHQPAEMPAWWSRRMNVRCPAGILHAAARAKRAAPASAPTLKASEKNAGSDPATPSAPMPAANDTAGDERSQQAPPTPRVFSDVQTLDIAANVEQLRRTLAIVSRQLEEARAGQVIDGKLVVDDNLVASRQRDYRDTFSELRKAENDLIAWQQQMGELVPRDEVRAENNRVAAAIFQAVLRLVKTVRPQLPGKSEPEQDRIWRDEVYACFASLKTAKFTTFDSAEVAA